MASTPVERDQFEISEKGITHKPTGAKFEPHPGNPHSGNFHFGQHGNKLRSGEDYRPDEVERMMERLWAEFVEGNPDKFVNSE